MFSCLHSYWYQCHSVTPKLSITLLSLTQHISTGLAIAGVIVIARSIRLVREKGPRVSMNALAHISSSKLNTWGSTLFGSASSPEPFNPKFHFVLFTSCIFRYFTPGLSFHFYRSQNFKLHPRSLLILSRGTSASEGKFVRSQKKDSMWSMSRFMYQAFLHYFQGKRVKWVSFEWNYEGMLPIQKQW